MQLRILNPNKQRFYHKFYVYLGVSAHLQYLTRSQDQIETHDNYKIIAIFILFIYLQKNKIKK